MFPGLGNFGTTDIASPRSRFDLHDCTFMPGNLLLAAMPSAVCDGCLERGEPFRFSEGTTIPVQLLDGQELFIVTHGVASTMLRSPSGRMSEVGMIGLEGMFPIGALLDVPIAKGTMVAQMGELVGLRIWTDVFHSIVAPFPYAASLVRKFTYAFIVQIASSVMSSEQDDVEQRVARWLLMGHDRIDGDDVHVTHDVLAQMAYSHRPTVTNVLKDLKARGLLETARGHVSILDRAELSRIADGAYGPAERYWREHIGPFGKDHPVSPTIVPAMPRAAAR